MRASSLKEFWKTYQTECSQFPLNPEDASKWQRIIQQGRAEGWLLEKDKVKLKRKLGEGSFGETFEGHIDNERVAIKCLRLQGNAKTELFARELDSLKRAQSPHIVKFLGAVIEEPQTFWLVLEFIAGGTLQKWLHCSGSIWGKHKRSLKEKVDVALGIAQGMQALEELVPQVIHRDLKPTNILLDKQGQPKISDFGLSRSYLEEENQNLTKETGSYLYMSPEVLQGKPYGPKADVHSFGILLGELLTGQFPYAELGLMPVQIAIQVADHGLRPGLPADLPAALTGLIAQCWTAEPDKRPSFSSIVTELQAILPTL